MKIDYYKGSRTKETDQDPDATGCVKANSYHRF